MNQLLRYCFLSLFLLYGAAASAQAPVADFTLSDVGGCPGLVVTGTDISTGSPTTWNWNFGNGFTSSSAGPHTTTYLTAGTYTVTLTVTNASGSSSASHTVTVYAYPTVNFTASPTAGCLPFTTQFSSGSVVSVPGPPASYDWSFGDGSPNSSLPNPIHTYNSTGPFDVSLSITSATPAECPGTLTKLGYITGYTKPYVSFSATPNPICSSPFTATFTNNSSGSPTLSWAWNFGNGIGTSAVKSPSYTYPTGGSFTTKLVVTDGHNCKDSSSLLIDVYTGPAVINSPASVCIGQPIAFSDGTPGATGSDWDFGDGFTGSGSSVTHVYNPAGSYTVKLTSYIQGGACTKIITKAITVNPQPVISMGFTPAIPCPAPSLVNFTATSNASNATYAWNFGDGHTAFGASVSNTYTNSGFKQVVVTVTNNATGCVDIATLVDFPIHNIIPEIYPSPAAGCIPFTPSFSAAIFTAPNPPATTPNVSYPVGIDPTTYSWSFPGGTPTSSTSANPSATYSIAGPYSVTLNAQTLNGCPFTKTIQIYADITVTAAFSASPLVVCPGDSVTFFNNSANVPGTVYGWDLGDYSFNFPATAYKSSFKHAYTKPGTYDVTHVTDHNGCQDPLFKKSYIVVNPSNADFDFTVGCAPNYAVTFIDKSIGPTSWDWDFGDGSTHYITTNPAAATPPPHIYPAAGTYQAKLTTYNSTYNCGDNFTKAVLVFYPVVNFSVNDRKTCKGDEVLFSGALTGPYAATYSWIIDSDPPTPYAPDNQLPYTFNTVGLHTVKLNTLYGLGGCLTSITKVNYDTVTAPVVNFTATPVLGCSPLQVTFTDASTPTPNTKTSLAAWSWEFGDGSVKGTTANPVHTYTTGVYDIMLKVTDNNNCSDSLLRPGYVEARKPYAFFTTSKPNYCAGEALVLTNVSTGATAITYLWDFGDGTTSTVKLPAHSYTAAGSYTITLTVTDASGCNDAITRTVTVHAPVASFTMDKNEAICPPLKINFANTSTGSAPVNYFWSFGTGGPPQGLNNPNQTFTYGSSGKYTITLVAVDANGCKDSAKKTATVLGLNGNFTYTPTTGCLPLTVTFKSSVSIVPKYTWDFGDGVVLNDTPAATVTHTYTSTGPFNPKVIFRGGNGCNPPDSGLIPIRPDKLKADFITSTPCADSPFTLTQTATAVYSPPTGWRWFFTPADSANGAVVRYTFAAPGNHLVTIIAANALGCADTLTKNVFINPKPPVDAGPADTGICPGDQARLIGHGALSYVWSSPTASVSCSACDTTFVSAAAPTKYYVIGTDALGCKNIDSITARIQIQTTADVKPGGDICIGESFRLSASGATIYKWSPVRFLDSPDLAAPLATPIITTNYVVEAQEGTCLVRYDTVRVVVHPSPSFNAGPDEYINYGAAVILQPTQTGIKSIAWRPDSSLSCLDCFRPLAHPAYTTIYYAKATSEWGCTDSGSVTVHVRCNGDSVFIPNTFSPNGDGANDVFYPRGKGVTHMTAMRVYNRWGELVFEATNFPLNDEARGWDGSYKGKSLPPDVYMYTMASRCDTGEPVVWKGDITLIR